MIIVNYTQESLLQVVDIHQTLITLKNTKLDLFRYSKIS